MSKKPKNPKKSKALLKCSEPGCNRTNLKGPQGLATHMTKAHGRKSAKLPQLMTTTLHLEIDLVQGLASGVIRIIGSE